MEGAQATRSANEGALAPAPWARTAESVLSELETSRQGLSSAEAARRLHSYGPNELEPEAAVRPATILLRQFRSPLIYILLWRRWSRSHSASTWTRA